MVMFKEVDSDFRLGSLGKSFLLHYGDLGANDSHSYLNLLHISLYLLEIIASKVMYWLVVWTTFGTVIGGLSTNDKKR